MDKNTEIMNLYNALENNGAKGKAKREIAKLCNRGVNTVKNHWFGSQDIPEEFQNTVLNYLKSISKNKVV